MPISCPETLLRLKRSQVVKPLQHVFTRVLEVKWPADTMAADGAASEMQLRWPSEAPWLHIPYVMQ